MGKRKELDGLVEDREKIAEVINEMAPEHTAYNGNPNDELLRFREPTDDLYEYEDLEIWRMMTPVGEYLYFEVERHEDRGVVEGFEEHTTIEFKVSSWANRYES